MTANLAGFADSTIKMPVLFVGHGSPMNAIGSYVHALAQDGLTKEVP